jgi:uncharacterized RDD family membrane protein YckC
VKCPKCGFVSYSGLAECKKCGHPFVAGTRKKAAGGLFSFFSSPSDGPSDPSAPVSSRSGVPVIDKPQGSALEPLAGPAEARAETAAAPVPVPEGDPSTWRDELSDRVEDFRRRRARLRGGFDPNSSLALEFGNPEDSEVSGSVGARVVEFSSRGPDSEMELPPLDTGTPLPDLLTVERTSEPDLLESVAVAAGNLEMKPVEAEPVEIVLESAAAPESAPAELHAVFPLAPVGRRFVAGVADLGVLLLGAALFSLIFWFAGGHISYFPLNVAVLGFVAIFFVSAYYGAFTALAGATPGLLLLGLEVRNWEGRFPTGRESLWRAFGYLVSAAALMLGFFWALVDSESLCWHDHISSTFVTTRKAD